MAGQNSGSTPKMPISGVQQYGSATGAPKETTVIKTGDDLRNGGGK